MHTEVLCVLQEKERTLHVVGPDATVADAVALMTMHRIGAAIVMSGEGFLGFLTETDVVRRVIHAKLDPSATRVSDVLEERQYTVEPTATVHEAMKRITENRCRYLAVCHRGEVLGLLSIGDLTRWVTRDLNEQVSHLIDYIGSAHA